LSAVGLPGVQDPAIVFKAPRRSIGVGHHTEDVVEFQHGDDCMALLTVLVGVGVLERPRCGGLCWRRFGWVAILAKYGPLQRARA
jgi:hypothetical protein